MPDGPTEFVQVTLDDLELVDPWEFNQTSEAAQLKIRPNGFKNKRGKEPGYGAVLVKKSDLDTILMINNGEHTLVFKTIQNDEAQTTVTVTYDNLVISHTEALFGANSPQDGDVYLVHLEDRRRIGLMTSFHENFNVPKFDYSNPTTIEWYESTINSGVPYTNSELIEEIWAELPTTQFPTSNRPTMTSTDFASTAATDLSFNSSAWEGIVDLAEMNHMVVTMEPGGQVYVVDPSNISTTLETFLADYDDRLIFANNHQATPIAIPEKLEFKFPELRYDLDRISDEKILTAGDMTLVNPVYTEERNVSTYSSSTTITGTKASYTVKSRYNPSSTNPDVHVNSGNDIDDVADEMAERIVDGWDNLQPTHKIFVGLIDVDMETGVDEVTHYSKGSGPDGLGGFFTEVKNQPPVIKSEEFKHVDAPHPWGLYTYKYNSTDASFGWHGITQQSTIPTLASDERFTNNTVSLVPSNDVNFGHTAHLGITWGVTKRYVMVPCIAPAQIGYANADWVSTGNGNGRNGSTVTDDGGDTVPYHNVSNTLTFTGNIPNDGLDAVNIGAMGLVEDEQVVSFPLCDDASEINTRYATMTIHAHGEGHSLSATSTTVGSGAAGFEIDMGKGSTSLKITDGSGNFKTSDETIVLLCIMVNVATTTDSDVTVAVTGHAAVYGSASQQIDTNANQNHQVCLMSHFKAALKDVFTITVSTSGTFDGTPTISYSMHNVTK